MLKDKNELVDYLKFKCEKIAFKNDQIKKIREYLYQQYNIPIGKIMDMICRSQIEEQTEYLLFCLLDGIDKTENTDILSNYYTEMEIDNYSKTKFEIETARFPMRIPCIQVTNEQWIGATDSKFLMSLRRAQIIKYNANAQRVMKKIVQGENILFKLVPNKAVIFAIKQLMKNKQYIPTTITLNISYESSTDFYYDSEARELVIKSTDFLDISDGYHRYLAMCELSDSNPEFTYPVEIRIINFAEEKTRQFIFQEDQKTKMAQADSRSMNINRTSNNIVDRLNEMSTFTFRGQIGRNSGTIDYATMSDLIEFFYLKPKKVYSNLEIMNIANRVKEQMNSLAEHNAKYITRIFSPKELSAVFYIFNREENIETAIELIDKTLESGVLSSIKYRRISKPFFNVLEQLI